MALIHPLMNEVDTSVWRPKQRHQRSLGQPSHPPSVYCPALFRLIRSLRSCTSSSPLFASDAAVRSETWVFFWWAISILCYFTFECSCIISTMCGNTEYIENKYCLSLSSIVTQLLVFIISIIHFFLCLWQKTGQQPDNWLTWTADVLEGGEVVEDLVPLHISPHLAKG